MAVLTVPPGRFLKKTLPPGCRFFPTELELILFYLENKLLGQKLARVERVMPEVDLYNSSPWDVAEKYLKCRDQQEYFFCQHVRKFDTSPRKKRSTYNGQWRSTGKQKEIIAHESQTVGMRTTLVFYVKGPLRFERTGWFIYEYSICNQLLGDSGSIKNDYVICKLFKKICSDSNTYEPFAVEDCEDYAYNDNITFIPNCSSTGDWSDKFCLKDVMEERVPSVPDNITFTSDFPGITTQEVTSYSESSSHHKTNGCHMSSFHDRNPVIHLSSVCHKNSLELERTLLNCPTVDIDSCSSQQPSTDPMCYYSLDFDQYLQQNEVGFRFSPTETQLILFYLRNKVKGQNLIVVDKVMPEVDIYNFSPWDISEKCLKNRDQQQYFFCRHQRKFPCSLRKRRSTDIGQWRTTGNDTPIKHKSQTVGMRKTLVFYVQGPLEVDKTNWTVYEYSLCDQQLGDSSSLKNDFVLCKLFNKSCSGSKYKPCAAEDCEDDTNSHNFAPIPNSSVTGGLRSDNIPCCSKGGMEETESCVPDNANFNYDFPGVTSQAVTFISESSSLHKSNRGHTFSLGEDCDINAGNVIAAHMSSFYERNADIHLSLECDTHSFDLERALLNCSSADIDSFPSQQEYVSQTKRVCNHPAELIPEVESHESCEDTFNILPVDELRPIDPQCYCTLGFDQNEQQYEIALMDGVMAYNSSVGSMELLPNMT